MLERDQPLLHVLQACAFTSTMRDERIAVTMATPDAVETVQALLRHVGLPQTFELYRADIRNAAATVVEGRRVIIYDEGLMNAVRDQTQANWSAIMILAHEIGHHLAGHTLQDIGSSHETEIEADRFAGFVLAQMGASLQESQLALQLLGSESASATHPARAQRLKAVAAGWADAVDLRAVGALPPPPPDIVPTELGYIPTLEPFGVEDVSVWDGCARPKISVSRLRRAERRNERRLSST
ncbi:hypothetical protein BH23GEM11_BH23GEM11_07490 [soil metagenome]